MNKNDKKVKGITKGLTNAKPKAGAGPRKSVSKKQALNSILKKKAIGSSGRALMYGKLGLKQDHTTQAKAKTSSATVKTVAKSPVKASVKTTKVSKPVDTKAAKVRARGQKALASGNTKKALRLRRKFDRMSK
tara:strand:+ start:6369 stop:6767 length:399 start_codon:yes stop_codon:yes gene_type:complete